jgi:hypothetical protein
MADAYGSGPYGETRGGSTPLVSTRRSRTGIRESDEDCSNVHHRSVRRYMYRECAPSNSAESADYDDRESRNSDVPSSAGVSRLRHDQEPVAGRGIHSRWRDLLLPGLRRRHRLRLPCGGEGGLFTPRAKADAGGAEAGRTTLRRSSAYR